MESCGKGGSQFVPRAQMVWKPARSNCALYLEGNTVISRFINTCWYFFKLGAMLLAVAAIGIVIFLFTRMNDEIRYQAEKFLAAKMPQFNVSVGGARIVEGRGVAIYDLTISETTNTHLQSNLLVVEEVMLACDARLGNLVKGVPEVERIIFKHPQIWAARNADGSWNLDSFWPMPKFGDGRPPLIVEDAQIAFTDLTRPTLPQLVLRDVHLKVQTQDAVVASFSKTNLHGAQIVRGQSPTTVSGPVYDIQGSLGGPSVKRAELHALLDPASKSIRLEGSFEQLQLTKDLQLWAIACCDKLTESTALAGKLDGNFSFQHKFGAATPPHVNAQVQLTEGRLVDPRLPRPLTDLSGLLTCQGAVMKVQNVRGKCDTATLVLQMEKHGWRHDAPLAMGVRVQDVPLDKALYRVLPPNLQSEWNKFRPAGIANAELQVTFDGKKWRPTATLTGRDLSFESDKFKYRLHNGSGTLRFTAGQPDVLDINIQGYGGGQPLQIVGQFFDPKPGALGWVEITGSNLEIEQRMIAALPDKTREVIQSIRPQGHFNVYWRLDRTQLGQLQPHTALKLELLDCRVNYERFPYPLRGIYGMVTAEDQHWTFRDLVASGSRNVECQGFLRPRGEGKELSLKFIGRQLQLDDDLRQALPPEVQRAWSELRPTGRVDLIADVRHLTGYAKPAIRVSVSSLPETATIHPKFFPYLLEHVQGQFDYLNGELLITGFRGEHGPTTLLTNGNGKFGEDGSWEIELTGMSVDRLELRRDLLAALPPKITRLIDQMGLNGKFSMHDTVLKFTQPSDPSQEFRAEWDMQLSCLQADIHPGVDLENIHGSVRLQGLSQGAKNYTSGELALDTVTFEDVQFTNIRGPFWADETNCLFGEWATKKQRLSPRRISAQAYGGNLLSDAWVTFDGVPKYSIVAALNGGDMLRLTKEAFNTQQDLQGNVAATLTLSGYGRSMHTLSGHGEVQVTEANIYELPLLVALLKFIRKGVPDTTAFDQVNTKYRIQGRHIYLDQLDFKGDAITLRGKGEANFDHQLKLVFYGVVGRNEINLPVVRDVLEKFGESTFQLYVDGTLSDPQIQTQPLPGINQLIQQIQTDLDATTTTPPRRAERVFPTLPSWGGQR